MDLLTRTVMPCSLKSMAEPAKNNVSRILIIEASNPRLSSVTVHWQTPLHSVKCTVEPLQLRTPMGQKKVSLLVRCPHFRG